MAVPVIAIVGRPNVGKSTLFNRLVGRREALVDDRPGVTRDRREGEASLAGAAFRVIDTAGLEEVSADALEDGMRRQTDAALDQADAALFLIDARVGPTPVDRHFANRLRRHPTPVVLAANKAEGRAGRAGLLEAAELGFGVPVALSAEHGDGMGDLYEALAPWLECGADEAGSDGGEPPLKLAVVGRPNVGKSTLINRLVGAERLLAGPMPGMTRDSIAVDAMWGNRAVRLTDTAGLRRRVRVSDRIERLAAADTERAIRFAEVVVLTLDATADFDRQDLTIARRTVDEGRALVIAANKWDLVGDPEGAFGAIADRIAVSLPQVRDVPVTVLSAATGRGVASLMRSAFAIREVWDRRIATGELNRWLRDALEAHPPPVVKGRRLKVRYATQVRRRPPTFALFVSQPAGMPESYLRYLANGIRHDLSLPGVPIRMVVRAGRNPYAAD